MKVAIWQTESTDLGRLRERALEAAAQGARLLVAPEAFTSGYAVPGVVTAAQAADGAWHREIAEVAAEAGLALLYGHPEREGDRVFNSATLVDRDGTVLTRHRKTHLFGDLDRSRFAQGEVIDEVVELDDLRVGVAICYDVEFPEVVRALALAGADLVAVPTALMQPFEAVPRTLVPARAYESQVFVAYANRIGTEGDLVYCGESCIVAPDGSDLARAGVDDELILADLDPDRLRASRAELPYLADLRPELYGAPSPAPLTEAEVLAATDHLVAAFAATDTDAYFASFAPEASFVFHPEARRFDDRATYEQVWAGWLAEGWSVVSCESTDRRVQVYGDTGILSHTVRTEVAVGTERTTSEERETIVFVRSPRGLVAVHEHLSPVPDLA